MENTYAPIIVFAFVRKTTLERVINALRANPLAVYSDLYIYIDGPRNANDYSKIKEVSNYCKQIDGFKSISITERKKNMGLDPSVINGVTEVLNKHGKAIVIEDDVITSSNFLDFMNQGLDTYKKDNRVFSISGFGINLAIPSTYRYDAYMFGRSSSWGWATWKDRWDTIDWEVSDWSTFSKNKKAIRAFNNYGGQDQFSMLKKCMQGGGMWDIRFCYNMFKHGKYSIIPTVSKSDSIGFDDSAIHCKEVKFKRYTVTLDSSRKRTFVMDNEMEPNPEIIKRRLRISSLHVRIATRIKNALYDSLVKIIPSISDK